jgi:hypothetical protein
MNGHKDLFIDLDNQTGFCLLRSSGVRINLESPSLDTQLNKVIETDDSLIVPFRMLSKSIIEGHWLDFSGDGVLEKGVDKFNNVTIYTDHKPSVNNWVGVATNARFVFGKPDGVNADFKIDKIKEPMIARGLKLEPPAIKSCSVGIYFNAEKSHPNLKNYEFYNRLGEEFDGSLVRYVVKEVLEVSEVSLVYAGADPHAKKLFKGWSIEEMDLDKKLNSVLVLFGLDMSTDFDLNLKSIETVVKTLQSENKRLESSVKDLETKLESSKKFVELGMANEREIREQALKNYRAFALETPDEKIVQLLEKGELGVVKSLGLDYKQRLEERHRLNANGNRQSSVVAGRDSLEHVEDFEKYNA